MKAVARYIVRRVVVFGLSVAVLAGCGVHPVEDSSPPVTNQTSVSNNHASTSTCQTHAEGCPCSPNDTVVQCGEVAGMSGSYRFCSEGLRTCTAGKWGECVGSRMVEQRRPHLALGVAEACPDNPCDPNCQEVVDTPSGITPPSGLEVTDAGAMTLAGSSAAPCTGLAVSPSAATNLSVVSLSPFTTSPTSVTFTASCATGTANPQWSLSNASGTAYIVGAISSAGVLTIYSPIAGSLTVTATDGALSATATVNVGVNINDTSLTTGAIATDFTGTATVADSAQALYPYANTMFPVYISAPLVQWDIGTGSSPASGIATGTRVALDYGTAPTAFHWSQIVTGEPQQGLTASTNSNVPGPYKYAPAYLIPQDVWSAFEISSAPTSPIAPGGALGANVSIQRYVGGALKLPINIPINIALAVPLDATVYYVQYERNVTNAHANDPSVTNVTFPYSIGNACPVGNGTHVSSLAGSGVRAVPAVGAAVAPQDPFNGTAGCAVCHSLSADGKTFLSVAQDIGDSYGGTATTGVNAVSATGTFSAISSAVDFNAGDEWASRGFSYGAVTPDGKYVLQGSEFWGNTANTPASANVQSAIDTDPGAVNPSVGGYKYVAYHLGGGTPAVAATTGLGTNSAPVQMMAPTFSPDGKHLVFVNGDGGPTPTPSTAAAATGWRKGISTFDFDESSLTFSNETVVVNNWAGGAGTSPPLKWPFYEPDSRSLLFVQTSTSEFCTSSDSGNPTNVPCYESAYGSMSPTTRGYYPGSIYSVDSQNISQGAVALANINNGLAAAHANSTNDDNLAYQPTVLSNASAGYRWAVFTSQRAYGNQLNNYNLAGAAKTAASCATSQIWMAAIADETSGTADRSFPPFWLPNQLYAPVVAGTASNQYVNERGYLVPSACKVSGAGATSACNVNSDCCSNNCRIDLPVTMPPTTHCYPAPVACSATGGTCTTATDCCLSTDTCPSGACVATVSYVNATFTRQYTASCGPGTEVIWENFQWNASAPNPASGVTSANIVFSAQAAGTVADLATATSVPLATANNANSNAPLGMPISNYNYVNVTNAFTSAAVNLANQSVLQVSMTFNTSSDNLQAPSLYDWNVAYDCVPSE